MSDFDKEAERERLREQYERDKQERKAAEQMSELLLQGATMTNTHCSTCGDPIFRYDGQEFCATCERPVDRDPADQDETDETAVSVADPDEDTRVVFGEESGDDQRAQARSTGRDTPVEQTDTPTGSTETEHATPAEQTSEEQTPTEPTRTQETSPEPTRTQDTSTAPTRTRETDVPVEQAPAASAGAETTPPAGAGQSSVGHSGAEVSRSTDDSDLGAARASLTRTLATFSRRAAATEDPRRAREHLEAAREAAEALAALRR
jgi:uncharacterized Zn finger protein (UPF0148 family)